MSNQYELKDIDPKEVAFGDNPRQEKPTEIREDSKFTQLIDSVYQFGVLVPIIVRKQKSVSGKIYRLIDGERRLRAALDTATPSIPAHVVKFESPEDDLMKAFHIHMLRKQWSNTAQTRALKSIIKGLPGSYKLHDKELFKKLKSLTGYGNATLSSFLRAANYSNKILDDVDNGKLLFSHLVQFEASFVEQLKQHYPKVLILYGKKNVRDILIRKAKRKVINTRSLLENIIPVINRTDTDEEKKFVEDSLKNFINEEDVSAEYVLDQFEKRFPGSQKDILEILENTLDTAERLESLLGSLPLRQIPSFPTKGKELLDRLNSLRSVISKKQQALKKIFP